MCHFSDCGINWTAGGLCQRNGGLPRARKFCTHCGLHSDECCIFTLTCYLHHHSGAAQRNRQVSFYFIHKWSYALNRHQRRTYSLLIPQGEIQLHTLIIANTWSFLNTHAYALRERWQSESRMPQTGTLSIWGFGILLKGTLAVLWRCPATCTPFQIWSATRGLQTTAGPPTALQNLFIISVRSTFTLFNADRTPLFQNCILLIWRVQRGKRKPKQRGIV